MRVFSYANMLMCNPSLPCFLSLSIVIEEELKDSDDLMNRVEDVPVPTLGVDNETLKAIENGWYRRLFVYAHTRPIASQQCLFSHWVLALDGAPTRDPSHAPACT